MINVYLLDVGTGDKFELPYSTIHYIEELNNGGSATFGFDYAAIIANVCKPYSLTIPQLFTGRFCEIYG